MEVGSLNLKVIGFSLMESILVFSFDQTWLVLVFGTPNHGSRARFWVSCYR